MAGHGESPMAAAGESGVMLSQLTAAVHETAPWYFAIPALGVAFVGWRFRRGGGGRGPFGRGPSSGPGDGV